MSEETPEKTRKRKLPGDGSRIYGCEDCGEADCQPNVEAFELSGKILCDECASQVFEDNSQFGVGA
jgi:hypothetical protein